MNRVHQVLLIDDDPLQLMVRGAVLRNAGFQVSIATTAESALSMVRGLRDHIGVIITDHIMPVCSGSEFVQRLRTENRWVPIIVLSGWPEAKGEYEGLRVVFKTKPMPPTDLIELVRSSLGHSNQERGAA